MTHSSPDNTSRRHRWIRTALALLIVALCVASVVGSAIVFDGGTRYLAQAKSLVIDAGSEDALRNHPKLDTEELISQQAQLAVATGRAMLLTAILLAVSCSGTLLTLIVGLLNHRAVMRRIDRMEQSAQDPPPARVRVKRHRVVVIMGVVIIGMTTAISLIAINSHHDAKWDQSDARLVQQIATESLPSPGDGAYTLPGLQLKMIWVAPGSFAMGGGDGHYDGKPITQVTLTRGFWLGRYELTQAQYNAIMHQDGPSTPDLPAQHVSWNDATAFCRKLTAVMQKAQRLPAGFVFTLPTEAQWEYACRAGTTGAYAGDIDSMAWYGGSTQVGEGSLFHGIAPTASTRPSAGPYPVGRKAPNAWGFYDMHGNSQEWCRDWYAVTLPGGTVVDPTGPATGVNRVERGGAWFSSAQECSSAARHGSGPNHRTNEGFRVALCNADG